VPTWWDQTKVLEAHIGACLVTARRKGDVWYIGGCAANQVPDFDLPLKFLGSGAYRVRVWKDASDSDTNPNHLTNETVTLRAADPLKIHFARDGGFVAELIPEH
jgi:alpha-glucosidase